MTRTRSSGCTKAPTGIFRRCSASTTPARRSRSSELGLDVYPNQIEVITAEQMLDAYSSIGMPLFYKHWSFGKHFTQHEALYRKGLRGLAYEIVINSSPCISYLMEENTATMQALVIAHAAFGHNHFFKNNYLFKLWTDADGILEYLNFAKGYVAQCEERYGEAAVERTLDAAHALMSHGVHRYPGKKKLDLRQEEQRERERRAHGERNFNDLWRTVPTGPGKTRTELSAERRRALLGLPQENILYFLEKSAPRLRALAARAAAHRAPHRAVFLSAGPDQGDERGRGDLRALSHHDPPARARRHLRRRFPGIPAVAHQCRLPAGLRRSALLGLQSLCARLRDDARHRADRHRTRRRGPAMVPRNRRHRRCDGGAARHLGQLSRRELHQPVSSVRA